MKYSNLFSLYLSLCSLVLFTSLKLYNWLFIPQEMSKLNLNFLYYISVVFSRLSGSKSIGRCSTNRRYVSIYQKNLHLAKVRNIWFFLLSFPQNERKIYQFCSVYIFFEGSVFTFQFLNDKIHNYVKKNIIVNFIIQKLKSKHTSLKKYVN